jgi:response regulator of citrate/malate metabolism
VFELDRYKSIDAGGTDFLPKPVQAEVLLERLQKYLHLNWIYEEGDGVEQITSKTMQPPTSEILNELLEMISIGDVYGVIEIAQAAETTDTAVFIQEVVRLANACEIKQLRALLQKYSSQPVDYS